MPLGCMDFRTHLSLGYSEKDSDYQIFNERGKPLLKEQTHNPKANISPCSHNQRIPFQAPMVPPISTPSVSMGLMLRRGKDNPAIPCEYNLMCKSLAASVLSYSLSPIKARGKQAYRFIAYRTVLIACNIAALLFIPRRMSRLRS